MNVQVLDHAETVKQLSQQEALVTELHQHQAAHEASGQAAHKAKVCALVKKIVNMINLYCKTCCQCAIDLFLCDCEKISAV